MSSSIPKKDSRRVLSRNPNDRFRSKNSLEAEKLTFVKEETTQMKPMMKGRKLIFKTRNNQSGMVNIGIVKSGANTDTLCSFLEEYGFGESRMQYKLSSERQSLKHRI